MLKRLGHSRSPFLRSLSTTPTSPNTPTSLDAFRKHLRKRLDHDASYTLPSIFRHIEVTARTAPAPAAVYEAAFEALVWRKRLTDGATVLLHMQKKGLLPSNATHATMLAVSLSTELPDTVTLENVLNNICDIVAHREYTAVDLGALLRVMGLYDVDRRAVAFIVNHFCEARGKAYKPPPALVPEVVEAMAREGEVEGAFKILDALDTTKNPDAPVVAGYHRLLIALRDACEWDPHVVDRVLRGVTAHHLPRQTPIRLLMAWAARREKYLSVLHFYNTILEDPDLACDVQVFQTLFEMHTTFLYHPEQERFAPLAPRTLFRSMAQLFLSSPPTTTATSPTPTKPKPTPYLLTTTLTAFLRQRDYAGALVVIDSFQYHNIPLPTAAWYTTLKFLVRRTWGDLSSQRKIKEGQVKWGDRFLGVPFAVERVALGRSVLEEVLDAVRRERFEVRERLYDPGVQRAKGSARLTRKQAQAEREKKREALEAKYGPVKYYIPSIEEMETITPGPTSPPSPSSSPSSPSSPDPSVAPPQAPPDLVFDATPLERLLRRALFAEVQMQGELDAARAEAMVRELVGQAREEMTSGEEGREVVKGKTKKDEAKKDEAARTNGTQRTAETGRKDEEDDMKDETEYPSEIQEEEEPQAAPRTSRTAVSSL